ncbi:MAG: formylglycine-generating enzyme family protein [Acidobacteriota bacterium]|nr:formylglycine-generating enzyme family protein [Acidobacteriota bacterium]
MQRRISALVILLLLAVVSVFTQQVTQPSALSKKDIANLLNGGVSNSRIVSLVEKRGVSFDADAEYLQTLKAAGASDDVTKAVYAASMRAKEQREAAAAAASHEKAAPRPGGAKVNPKDGLTYVWIPPGTFQMGCSPGDSECGSDEEPAHTATITRGFWMGQTEVTQAAYQRVTGANPSHFHGDRLPVETVNWDEARSYCGAVGMRLPTEAEWEYAARAGSTSARYGDLDAVAWYRNNSGDQTDGVGQKQPNAWQLYDMLGNVWEWVNDWYGENYYGQSPAQDPSGPPSGEYRTLRGGSWSLVAKNSRGSYRSRNAPADRGISVGFRCVGE